MAVCFGAIRGHGDALGGVGLPVIDEDVLGAVGVVRNEVRGGAPIGHIAAVSRNLGFEARVVCFGTIRVYGDALGGVGLPVIDEDVLGAVGIVRDEVRGKARIGHIA